MGAAKKQRTIDYFQRQGQIEIAKLVAEDVRKAKEKQAEKKKPEEAKSIEEK